MVIINQIGKLLVEAPTGVWEKIIMAFNSNIANYALAIICMTLVIKLILFPFDFLNRKFTRKSTKMQAEIQPEIDVLKKKYGNNQKELNAKTTKKVVLRLECSVCKRKSLYRIKRCKTFVLGGTGKVKSQY